MSDNQKAINELQEKIVRYFCDRPSNFSIGRPYNCCKSVLMAMAGHLGSSSDLIPKIGTELGAGVGLNGLLYGSVSSVAIAIGIKYGRKRSEYSPKQAWDMIDKYVASFLGKFGAVNCRQLTGLNLKTQEGLKEYFARVHDYECTERKFAVENAVAILKK